MPQDERGLYWPWYGTRYLLSRTRFLLTKSERSVYRDILDMLYEAGGGITYDPDYICYVTEATPEELARVLEVSALEKRNGRLYHPVADALIAEMVDFRESGRRGGVKSGEARREKAIKSGGLEPPSQPPSEPPSNGSHAHRRDRNEPPSERTTKQKEGRKEGRSASAPPEGARSRVPQSVPQPSPAGSAPAARAGGAAPARPALTEVLPPREKWPLTASDYLNREGWRVHPVTGQDTPPDGWTSRPVGGGPVEPAAPHQPDPPPKITREERAAAVRAQAAAIKAAATPEQLAEIEERLAAQDAAAHPAPAAVEGGDA